MSDVVVVMHHGRIQQQGPPSELYERPVNRFVAGFLGHSNFIAGRLVDYEPDRATALVRTDSGLTLAGRVTDPGARPGAGADVTVAVRPERIHLERTDDGTGDAQASSDRGARVKGTVREATYLGEQSEYRLTTGLGEIVARRQNNVGSEAARPIGPGDTVVASWSDQANLVLMS